MIPLSKTSIKDAAKRLASRIVSVTLRAMSHRSLGLPGSHAPLWAVLISWLSGPVFDADTRHFLQNRYHIAETTISATDKPGPHCVS